MAGEEEITGQDQVVGEDNQVVVPNHNEPEIKPLSETGYQVNPDGSVSHPGEKWDKE